MTTIEQQIKRVQELRLALDSFVTAKANLEREFEWTNRELFKEFDNTKQLCAEAEKALRELTLQAYAETGNKAPAPGVGIRIITRLVYDAGLALSWAKHHEIALKLDTSAFEKIAKASKPDFVEIQEEAQATIATDLSKVLKETLFTAYQDRRDAISGKGG